MNSVFVGFSRIFLLGILIYKGLTARRLYKSFGVKGLKKQQNSWGWGSQHSKPPNARQMVDEVGTAAFERSPHYTLPQGEAVLSAVIHLPTRPTYMLLI
jgi:hypothetical protein